MLRVRALPTGFIAPCLPTKTTQLPSGGQWLHEIKRDGFRIIARKHAVVSAVVTNEIERGNAVSVAGDSFTIDNAGARA
jgi:hypothetical protein